jgi:hypothetical protein
MRVHVSSRLSADVHARIVERALLEERSVSAMIERLLKLGLGTVVTGEVGDERGGSAGSIPAPNGVTTSSSPVTTDVCLKAANHRPGSHCTACGESFPMRDFRPDPKVK